MLTPLHADKIISQSLPKFKSQTVSLNDAYGAVLDEDIKADRDMPAFDKALMDGIAISYSAWKKGRREFTVQAVQSAGKPPHKLLSDLLCFEITTGSVIPHGCDCVIPIEKVVLIKENSAFGRLTLYQINNKVKLTRFQNIQPRASDQKKGNSVLKKGVRLLAPQIAIAASVGKTKLKIKERLRVAVIATGDELVSISSKPTAYQTRLSNSVFIKTALDHTGLFASQMFHLKDDPEILQRELKKILKEFSVLVLSGGVSKGKFDYVPEVLKELGVKEKLHRIAQRPGGPMWFGIGGEVPVFALPGNPVSTQICLYRYVIPHLKSALGASSKREFVKLSQAVKLKTHFTYFLPVRISYNTDAVSWAVPVFFQSSGNLTRLAQTDGFVELQGGKKIFSKGKVVSLYRWS